MKYKVGPRGLTFQVKVQPGASETAIQGTEGEFLKIRLAAPPVDGKANEELIRFLSRKLNLPKARISIRTGAYSKRKILLLEQFSEVNFQLFLQSLGKV